MIFFDLAYRFPSSYDEAHNTCLYFYPYYVKVDSLILSNQQLLHFVNEDDSLLVVIFDGDTLTKINPPCKCVDVLYQDTPIGPRAFDAQANFMSIISVHDGDTSDRLFHEIIGEVLPSINEELRGLGYEPLYYSKGFKEQRYLLCQYSYDSDSLFVIPACKRNAHLLDKVSNLKHKQAFRKYCEANQISVLYTPVWVFVPPKKNDQ